MLPAGTLQSLIRRYQAARAKMEALAAEVAASLALPGQGGQLATPTMKQRRAPAHVTNGETGGKWRFKQIMAAVRKNGPSTARDMVRLVPGCSMSSAYTILARGVEAHALVRTEKGVYVAADSHAALPAIMRQAVKKVAGASMREREGGPSKAQRLIDLAEKKGGVVTVDDAVAAKLFSSRKLARQSLDRSFRLGRFVRSAPGRYELKKSPAG